MILNILDTLDYSLTLRVVTRAMMSRPAGYEHKNMYQGNKKKKNSGKNGNLVKPEEVRKPGRNMDSML